MSMHATLQMVSKDEIAALEADPTTINQLDQPRSLFVNLQQTLCYLLTGDSYPGEDASPLAIGLYGHDDVPTPTLENGSFDLVRPERAADIAAAYAAVDRAAFEAKAKAADYYELVEEHELYDVEAWLGDDAAILEALLGELEQLQEFYAEVAEGGSGVAIYVS